MSTTLVKENPPPKPVICTRLKCFLQLSSKVHKTVYSIRAIYAKQIRSFSHRFPLNHPEPYNLFPIQIYISNFPRFFSPNIFLFFFHFVVAFLHSDILQAKTHLIIAQSFVDLKGYFMSYFKGLLFFSSWIMLFKVCSTCLYIRHRL